MRTMSYVEKVMVSGEKILHEGRFHIIQYVAAICLGIVVVGIFWLISMLCTEMVITNRRLIYKRGWIARKTEEISLHRIEEINMTQSILGRLLGYGRLETRGMGGGKISLPTIARPISFRRELQEAQARVEQNRD